MSKLTWPEDLKLYDVIEFSWIDSFHNLVETWESAEDYSDDLDDDIHSIGYFLRRTPRFLVIAQSNGGDQYGGIWRVPIGCITRIEKLR